MHPPRNDLEKLAVAGVRPLSLDLLTPGSVVVDLAAGPLGGNVVGVVPVGAVLIGALADNPWFRVVRSRTEVP